MRKGWGSESPEVEAGLDRGRAKVVDVGTMKFSEILKAARNAWGFAWPPIVALAVIFLVADFVSVFSVKEAILKGVGDIRHKVAWVKEVRELLDEYGLAKMVTVFAGVLLVVVLYLIKHVGLSLVGALPPYLEISMPRLLLKMLPEKEVVRLLRRYPGAKDFEQAYEWALAEHESSLPKPLDPPETVGSVVNQLTKLAAVAAIVVACGSVGSDFGHLLGRVLIVMLICGVVWLGTAVTVLHEQHRLAQELWFAFRKGLLAGTAALTLEEISEDELETARAEKEGAKTSRWWRIRLLDGRVLAWCREHLGNG
jgi:hypothetical protein